MLTWVTARLPKCTHLPIEANGADTADLETAEAEAVTLGAHIVSNSWICYGSASCVEHVVLRHAGRRISRGVGRFRLQRQRRPRSVLRASFSVGGTNLSKNGSSYTETAWNGAGSGCATGVTKPSWQHDTGCSYRTDSDISAEAGCSPGVAEYDTYGEGGWITECGTSAATPLIAAVYGLAGNASSQNAAENLWKLKKKKYKKSLYDITTGDRLVRGQLPLHRRKGL